MALQNTFYILGIIYMILGIVILIGIVVLLFYIKKIITDIHDKVDAKIEAISSVTSRSAEIAAGVGAFLAEKTKGFMRKKRTESE